MRDLLFEDISTLGELYRTKSVSPVEVTRYQLARIQLLNPTLKAFISIMEEQAIEEAQQLERELILGTIRSPLHGVPIAVKDIVQTEGTLTTAGSKVLAEWIPDEDATVVKKLKAAGAIIIGKANLHEFAMGATTENPHYGNARNPWDLQRIAGGSSGGSAVAVAAGLSFAAIGSDTAGSIRLPSALCGIVGFKPTYGRVSRYGCIPFSWSLDHIGPMARSVKDSAILFDAITGFDAKDQSSVRFRKQVYSSPPTGYLKGKRFGICREYFFDQVHPEITGIMNSVVNRLENLGAEIIEIEIPGIPAAQQALKWIAQAEGYAFHKPIFTRRPDLYSADIRYRLQFGSNVTADEYLNAQKTRGSFINEVLKSMEGLDALTSPMNHNPPFEIGSVTPEQAINNMFHLAKAPLGNLLGFPAITIPAGFMQGNLPVGLQLIGRPHADHQLLRIAESIEYSEYGAQRLKRNDVYETKGAL